MLTSGQAAPDFALPDQNGELVQLTDFVGSWVLLWWFPKAATPGCTVEGLGLGQGSARLEELGVTILGASFDTVADNKAFADDQEFPFRLLSDVDRDVGAAYGVARDPLDKFADFARRFSYLIDPDGLVRHAYDVTDVAGHAEAVIADVEQASAQR